MRGGNAVALQRTGITDGYDIEVGCDPLQIGLDATECGSGE